MMPKGVEHPQVRKHAISTCSVRIPMMPKGVEHWFVGEIHSFTDVVRIPMMPKGVEHLKCSGSVPSSSVRENSDDAERR